MSDDQKLPDFNGQDTEKVIPVSDDLLQHLANNAQQNPAVPKSPDTTQPRTAASLPAVPSSEPSNPLPDLTGGQPAQLPTTPTSPISLTTEIAPPGQPNADSGSVHGDVKIAQDAPLASEVQPAPHQAQNLPQSPIIQTAAPPSPKPSINLAGEPQPLPVSENVPVSSPTPAGTQVLTEPTSNPSITQPTSQVMPNTNLQEAGQLPQHLQNPVPPQNIPPGNGNLTPEQVAYINSASMGPLWTWIYFFANGSIKWGIITFLGPSLIGFAMQLLAGSLMESILQPMVESSQGQINPILGMAVFSTAAIFLLSGFVSQIVISTVAIKLGRRIAWNSKKWDSFEGFVKNQKKWSTAGWALLILVVVAILLLVYLLYSIITFKPSPSF